MTSSSGKKSILEEKINKNSFAKNGLTRLLWVILVILHLSMEHFKEDYYINERLYVLKD